MAGPVDDDKQKEFEAFQIAEQARKELIHWVQWRLGPVAVIATIVFGGTIWEGRNRLSEALGNLDERINKSVAEELKDRGEDIDRLHEQLVQQYSAPRWTPEVRQPAKQGFPIR